MKLLAQIPLVMGIREQADNGAPVAVELEKDPAKANAEACAFGLLARNVVEAVEKRNADLPATQKVEVNKKN